MVEQYRYRMVRVVCKGKIKSCNFCNDLDYEKKHEGYCTKCGRPLDKKPGDECNFIVGYVDHLYKQQDKVHMKCKMCSTLTTV
jgi:deoxyribodipyrimidine photolyase-like uncharacterized protein